MYFAASHDPNRILSEEEQKIRTEVKSVQAKIRSLHQSIQKQNTKLEKIRSKCKHVFVASEPRCDVCDARNPGYDPEEWK